MVKKRLRCFTISCLFISRSYLRQFLRDKSEDFGLFLPDFSLVWIYWRRNIDLGSRSVLRLNHNSHGSKCWSQVNRYTLFISIIFIFLQRKSRFVKFIEENFLDGYRYFFYFWTHRVENVSCILDFPNG